MVTLSHARFLQRTTARVRRQGDADTVEAGPLGSTSASAIQKRFNEPHNPTSFPPTRKRLLIHTWYDQNGNQALETEPSASRTSWTWDFEDRPTLVKLPSGGRNSFVYNGDGQCVQKQDSTGTTTFVRDFERMLVE